MNTATFDPVVFVCRIKCGDLTGEVTLPGQDYDRLTEWMRDDIQRRHPGAEPRAPGDTLNILGPRPSTLSAPWPKVIVRRLAG